MDTTFVPKTTTIAATWLQAVNDSLYRGRNPNFVTSTNVGNAYTITIVGQTFAPPQAGDKFAWKASATNTGAATLTIVGASSMGPYALVHRDGTALVANDIISGSVIESTFDGTSFQVDTKAEGVNNTAATAVTYLPGLAPYSIAGQTGNYGFLVKNPSPGASGSTREADFLIQRNTNYVGGTTGNVNSALQVETNVNNTGTVQFEWTTNFTMVSKATAGNSLANASFAFKYGLGSVWGSNILAWDKTGFAATDTVNGTAAGAGLSTVELNLLATGADTSLTVGSMTNFGSRNVIDVVVNKNAIGEGQCEIGSGLRFIPTAGDRTAAKFRTGIDFAIDATTGINYRGTYTNGIVLGGTYTSNGISFSGSYGTAINLSTATVANGIHLGTSNIVATFSASTQPHIVPFGGYSTTSWTNLTLLNSWVAYAAANNSAPSYYIDAIGIVHLRGAVTTGTIGLAIATLPAGFRPAGFVNIPVVSLSVLSPPTLAACYITVNPTTGDVGTAGTGSNVLVSLDGVSFKAA